MLQLFDDGRLTDSKGDVVSFSESIVILTSNAGANEINNLVNETRLKNKLPTYEQLANIVTKALKKRFRPEFLNRIDDITIFRPLTKTEVFEIAEILLTRLKKKLKKKENVTLNVSKSVKEFVVKKGYNPQYGARPLRRAFTHLLENTITTKLQSEENEFNFIKYKYLFVTLDARRTVKIKILRRQKLI